MEKIRLVLEQEINKDDWYELDGFEEVSAIPEIAIHCITYDGSPYIVWLNDLEVVKVEKSSEWETVWKK